MVFAKLQKSSVWDALVIAVYPENVDKDILQHGLEVYYALRHQKLTQRLEHT